MIKELCAQLVNASGHFTMGAASVFFSTTIIDTQMASSVEANNQLVNSSKSVSVSNEFASNNHLISTLVLQVSIVLLLIGISVKLSKRQNHFKLYLKPKSNCLYLK